MPKKEPKLYPFAEYPETPTRIRLLDGQERRIRLTLATVRRFETFRLVDENGPAKSLDYEQIAELLWAVLPDKDDLEGPAQLLELVTASMLPELLLAIQEAATAEGTHLKNGWARVQERAGLSPGPASTLSPVSSSASPLTSTGPIPSSNLPV